MATLSFDGFGKTSVDAEVEHDLQVHFEKFNVSSVDAVKHFPTLARRQLLKRFLAHSELFKMTIDIPGDIMELGVFRGLDLMTWANLLEAYSIGNRTKNIYGFDNWQGFSGFSPEDGAPNDAINKVEHGFNPGAYKEELLSAIAIFDKDRFIPWKPRIKLIEGQIEDTVPQFVLENPGVRYSLVHFDCDLYKPTKAALEAVWPKMSRGGLMLFDEYALKDWPGETLAVDEFLADKPQLQLKTLSWTNAPAAYLIVP